MVDVPTALGDGVRLRGFTERDLDLVVDAALDSRITEITSLSPESGRAEALEFIARQQARLDEGRGYAFALTRDDDVAVGHLYLGLQWREAGRAPLGYWIGPAFRGQGLAARGLRSLADWSDAELRIPRLELHVEPQNVASIRAAERAGFEREGLLRSWREIAGERRDMWMYSRIGG